MSTNVLNMLLVVVLIVVLICLYILWRNNLSSMTKLTNLIQHNKLQNKILSTITQGILIIDKDYKIIFINAAAFNILGIDKLDSKSLVEFNKIIKTKFNFLNSQNIYDSKQEYQIVYETQHLATQKTLQIICSPDKNNTELILVISDVSQILELENVRRNFGANVSHELKTPLTVIQGFAETLSLNKGINEQKRQEFIEIIHTQSIQLNTIVDDILSLSSIESGIQSNNIKYTKTKIDDVVEKVLTQCQTRAIKKSIRLKYIKNNNIVINVNAHLVERALVNLVDNAIKYSLDDKQITITAVLTTRFLEISVKDNGIGITKKEIPRLLERFYRVDRGRSRNTGGTGLGLSIVKHICSAHNGNIDIKSEFGIGSVFTIKLAINL